MITQLTADIGTVNSGYIRNSGNTAPIRLSGTTTLPSTNHIDFTASGSSPFLKHRALTLEADGDVTFSGNLSAASGTFTGEVTGSTCSATVAEFSGSIHVKSSGTTRVAVSTGVPIYDSGGTARGVLRGTSADCLLSSASDNGKLQAGGDVVISPVGNLDVSSINVGSTSAGSLAGHIRIEIGGTTHRVPHFNES